MIEELSTSPEGLFTWHPVPEHNGTVLLPWLDRTERKFVKRLFRPPMTITEVSWEGQRAVMLVPRVEGELRQMVEEKLLAYWSKEAQTNRTRATVGRDGTATLTTTSRPPAVTPPPPPRTIPPKPTVVFRPHAWMHYRWAAQAQGGHTEVAGLGECRLTGPSGTVIRIVDFITPPQKASPALVELDTTAINRIVSARCREDPGFNPKWLLAGWCHTHPGFSKTPSSIDWDTFADHVTHRARGNPDWSLMIILTKEGDVGCHLRQTTAFGVETAELAVSVDWFDWESYALIDVPAWEAEYMANVWPSAKDYHPEHRTKIGWQTGWDTLKSDSSWGTTPLGGFVPMGRGDHRMPPQSDADDDGRPYRVAGVDDDDWGPIDEPIDDLSAEEIVADARFRGVSDEELRQALITYGQDDRPAPTNYAK